MWLKFLLVARSVERGVQGVPQESGPDFSGRPEILGIPRYIYTKMKKLKKWIDLALFCYSSCFLHSKILI